MTSSNLFNRLSRKQRDHALQILCRSSSELIKTSAIPLFGVFRPFFFQMTPGTQTVKQGADKQLSEEFRIHGEK